MPKQLLHRELGARLEEHVPSPVALEHEVLQGLARVAGKIPIDRKPDAVVDKLLQNLARQAGAQDEEVFRNRALVDRDVRASRFILILFSYQIAQ